VGFAAREDNINAIAEKHKVTLAPVRRVNTELDNDNSSRDYFTG
jgi:hypothetical protein